MILNDLMIQIFVKIVNNIFNIIIYNNIFNNTNISMKKN